MSHQVTWILRTSRSFTSLFFDLRDNFGQTIIIVTHDRELAQMSDREIQIIDGMIV